LDLQALKTKPTAKKNSKIFFIFKVYRIFFKVKYFSLKTKKGSLMASFLEILVDTFPYLAFS
jgi:hypothetical protein